MNADIMPVCLSACLFLSPHCLRCNAKQFDSKQRSFWFSTNSVLITKILLYIRHSPCFPHPKIFPSHDSISRSQWPRGPRRRPAVSSLLRLWVRIPPRAWMSVCRECCVLSSRGLCDGLITRPDESYRLWCVVVCDLETCEWGRHSLRWDAAPQEIKRQY